LQLTVPALEKLFEGQPDFVLQLRQAAMQEFTKRRIKGILTQGTQVEIDNAIKSEIGAPA